jgi:predicted flap endonuclease-1-like 5' DNA nuclease
MENAPASTSIFQNELILLSMILLLLGFVLGVIVAWMIWGSKVRSVEKEMKQREDELTLRRAELTELKAQFEPQEAELKKLSLHSDDLDKKIKVAEKEKKQMSTDLSVAHDQIEQLRLTNAGQISTIEDLQNQILALKTKANKLKKETQAGQDELGNMAQMQSTYNAALSKLQMMEEKFAQLTADNQKLKDSLSGKQKTNAVKPATPAPKPEKKPAAPKPAKPKAAAKPDDLKIIEGIGPKIETLLLEKGINSFKKLAKTTADQLRLVLANAGSRFRVHDPSSWPKQAEFAANGDWEKLKEYQNFLTGGRNLSE